MMEIHPTMDHNEIERKKQKILHWIEIAMYIIVGLVVTAKVLPIFWRMMT